MRSRTLLSCLAIAVAVGGASARADGDGPATAPAAVTDPARPAADPASEGRVPLRANFSEAETDGIGVIAVVDLFAYAAQASVSDPASRDPVFGAPPAFDLSITNALYRGPGAGKWLGGVPDTVGLFVAPGLTIAFYSADLGTWALTGKSFTGDYNPDHKLIGLIEAYSITMGLNQFTKLSLGRERPLYYLKRPDAGTVLTGDSFLSFNSGHTASTFCLATWVQHDVTNWLLEKPLAHATPAARLWLGHVVPIVGLYGMATVVGLSRIIDQEHYFSDVAVAALTGFIAANIVYVVHFDLHGHPRRRHPLLSDPIPTTMNLVGFPGGIGLNGTF